MPEGGLSEDDEDEVLLRQKPSAGRNNTLLLSKDSSLGSGPAWNLAKVSDTSPVSPAEAVLEEDEDPPNGLENNARTENCSDPGVLKALRDAENGVQRNRGVHGTQSENDNDVDFVAVAQGDGRSPRNTHHEVKDTVNQKDMDVLDKIEAAGSINENDLVLHSVSGQFVKIDVCDENPKPDVVQLPEAMWDELVDISKECFLNSLKSSKPNSTEAFAELAAMTGCMPLAGRNDPDVAFMQLLKDIKRESVCVNDHTYMGASSFDALYSALERLLTEHDPALKGISLEHKVQRLLRSCSRTVSGYDSFEIVSALFSGTDAMVTPAMMDNSPIRVQSDTRDGLVTVSSTNVFKISHQLQDGGLATVVVLKTEISEQIELDAWHTVRWMSLKPLDRAEECVNSIMLFRERTLDALLKTQMRAAPGSSNAHPEEASPSSLEHNKRVLEVLTEARSALDLALAQSIKAIRELTHAEYLRGRQDEMENPTQHRATSDSTSTVSSGDDSDGGGRARSQSPIGVVGQLASEAAKPIAKLLGSSSSSSYSGSDSPKS